MIYSGLQLLESLRQRALLGKGKRALVSLTYIQRFSRVRKGLPKLVRVMRYFLYKGYARKNARPILKKDESVGAKLFDVGRVMLR